MMCIHYMIKLIAVPIILILRCAIGSILAAVIAFIRRTGDRGLVGIFFHKNSIRREPAARFERNSYRLRKWK